VREERQSENVTLRNIQRIPLSFTFSVFGHTNEALADTPPAAVFDPYRFGAKGDGASNDRLASF
jgi:hypothetical protein